MTRRYVVPGRVELVGKHVDYGGGRSLTCAVEFAMRATANPLKERVLRVRQRGSRDVVEVPLSSAAAPTRSRWSMYVAAVARRIGRDFPHATGGVDVRLSSTLPPAAGLSSSTALTIALARAVVDATGLTSNAVFAEYAGSPITFAEYVAAIETGAPHGPFPGDDGVGVRGGAQDHVAIMCAREGMVGQFAYIPAGEEGWAPWPGDHMLAIGVSGVRASKTGNAQAAYNRAADAVRWMVRQWNGVTYRDDPTLAAALARLDRLWRPDLTLADAVGLMDKAIEEVRKRLVVAPSAFVVKVVDLNPVYLKSALVANGLLALTGVGAVALPLAGVAVWRASARKAKVTSLVQFMDERIQSQARQSAGGQATGSIADKIRDLASLRDQGLVTSEEFEKKRQELLKQL